MKSTSCLVCQKEFTRSDNLRRHMKIAHRTSQPYPKISRVFTQTPPPPPAWNRGNSSSSSRKEIIRNRGNSSSSSSSRKEIIRNRGSSSSSICTEITRNRRDSSSFFTWKLSQNMETFKFEQPFTMIIAGPTMSGKSIWIKNLLLLNAQLISSTAKNPLDF